MHSEIGSDSYRVLSAGWIGISSSGEILEINNQSGHYLPYLIAIKYFLSVLHNLGYSDMNDICLNKINFGDYQYTTNVDDVEKQRLQTICEKCYLQPDELIEP